MVPNRNHRFLPKCKSSYKLRLTENLRLSFQENPIFQFFEQVYNIIFIIPNSNLLNFVRVYSFLLISILFNRE
ncbi:hypothetical protein BWD11_14760 [Leptospira santarosai serovar Grippotyphosa]|nr:hypothetical protein BWD11_14760 [Leptospira santarosai serovar Grippotyphosa]